MTSVLDVLEEAEFPTGKQAICLRMDLVQKLNDLRIKQIVDKRKESRENDKRLGAPMTTAEAAEAAEEEKTPEILELEQKIANATITFHMTGIGSKEYNTYQRQAGRPREGNASDKAVGFNLQAYYELLIRRCTTKVTSPGDPEGALPDAKWWDKLWIKINDGQFDLLAALTQKLNRELKNPPTLGQI